MNINQMEKSKGKANHRKGRINFSISEEREKLFFTNDPQWKMGGLSDALIIEN